MDVTVTQAHRSASERELSPGQRYGLIAAAMASALLGLTTLDVDETQALNGRHAGTERTPECIVASALFVGAAPVSAP